MDSGIPVKFRWKLAVRDITIDGQQMKSVTADQDDVEMVKICISELKSRFSKDLPVVGIQIKEEKKYNRLSGRFLLVLCVNDLCVYFEWDTRRIFPKSFIDFLSDKSICFVGYCVDDCLDQIRRLQLNFYEDICKSGIGPKAVEIEGLAAQVLKTKPKTLYFGFPGFAYSIGCQRIPECVTQTVDISQCEAQIFTANVMQEAFAYAYHSCQIGMKLLGMI